MRKVLKGSEPVFHYTSYSVFTEQLMATEKLKFNLLKYTNDPRENKYRHYGVGGFSLGNDAYKKSEIVSKKLNEVVLNHSKICCFCRNSSNGINHGFAKSRMWSQYGENHKGVCLVFSKVKLLRTIKTQAPSKSLVYGDKVIYSSKGINLVAMQINGDELETTTPYDYTYDHINEHYKEIFYKKDIDYRDEREFRVTVIDDSKAPKYFNINDSLIGVILGVDFDGANKLSVIEYCAVKRIACYKMYLDTKGKIRIREITKDNC